MQLVIERRAAAVYQRLPLHYTYMLNPTYKAELLKLEEQKRDAAWLESHLDSDESNEEESECAERNLQYSENALVDRKNRLAMLAQMLLSNSSASLPCDI